MDFTSDVLITVKELGQYLSMKPQAILRQARRGVIPSRKVGGRIRFLPKEVKVWLDSCSVKALPRGRVRIRPKEGEENPVPV